MVENEDTGLIAAAAGHQPRTLAEPTATDGDRLRRDPQHPLPLVYRTVVPVLAGTLLPNGPRARHLRFASRGL